MIKTDFSFIVSKCHDGVVMPLTKEEQIDYDARLAAAPALQEAADAKAKIPDLATQMFGALVKKGALTNDDIHPDTLAIVNQKLSIGDLNAK